MISCGSVEKKNPKQVKLSNIYVVFPSFLFTERFVNSKCCHTVIGNHKDSKGCMGGCN